jgi:site-specific DNA-methyltransferase (adenine-specific)
MAGAPPTFPPPGPADPDPLLTPWLDQITTGDCLTLLPHLPDQSVHLILADLPYGTTRNKWDSIIDLPSLWAQYERVITANGAIVLTAAQPFTSILVTSNLHLFKYEWIWAKTIGSGQLNIHHQPLRAHESVLVFYRKPPTYHPQMTSGDPYTIHRKASDWTDRGYNNQRDHTAANTGVRHPKTVLTIANPRITGGHPTQKPVDLFTYLIRTYTNPGDIVLDNVIGSGTTAVAAQRTGRHFIGMELDPGYAAAARARLADEPPTSPDEN